MRKSSVILEGLSKIAEMKSKGRNCDNCEAYLEDKDYKKSGSWDYKCPKCGFNYKHGVDLEKQLDKFNDSDESKKVEDETKVDEMKVFDVKALATFAGNVLSNKYGAKNVSVEQSSREGNDFYILLTFMAKTQVDNKVADKLSNEIINQFVIPTSSTGGGFGVNILEQNPTDKGFIVSIEIYN